VISALRRAFVVSSRFLWSFVVDDTPEVLVVVVVVVGAAYALGRHAQAAAVVVVPLLAIAGLGLCVWRACRSHAKESKS
jgi:hypothetical protein